MRKVLALVLAVLMLIPALVACGGGNGTTTTTPPSSQPTGPSGSEPITDESNPSTPGTPSTPKEEFDTPLQNYNYDFRVISVVDGINPTAWGSYDIVYDENATLAAPELQDKIKERNDKLKEDIGVTIQQIPSSASALYSTVFKSVGNNKNEYDMVLIRPPQAAQLAQKGYLANIQDHLTYVDEEKSWYDQRAMEQLAIKGKNYFFYSDITVVNLDAIWLYYFNTGLIGAYQLQDPYELFADGKWTLDVLLEMCDTATDDDGNGTPGKEDKWGIAGHDYIITSAFHGTGIQIASTDATGNIVLTMNDSRIPEFTSKITQLHDFWCRYAITAGSYETVVPYGFAAGDNYAELTALFAEGNTLFLGEVLANSRDLSLNSVDEDQDIGMLATPKLNDTQTEYYTPVNNVSPITCIPITACGHSDTFNGLEMASAIVDTWAYYSQSTVNDTYINACQKSRYNKNEISRQTIDMIFDAVCYDVGAVYAFGELAGRFTAILYNGNTDFKSMYDGYSGTAQDDINKFMRGFK